MIYLFEITIIILLGISLCLIFFFFFNSTHCKFIDSGKHIKDMNGQMFKFYEKIDRLNLDLRNIDSTVSEFKSPMQTINRYLTSTGSLAGKIGEWGLEAIIKDVLTEQLYETNHRPNPDTDHEVEYAVKMPGSEMSYLCIDSKLPITALESYVSAIETNDSQQIMHAKQQIKADLTVMATDIKSKYIVPNHTPDFAVMFVIEKVNRAIDTIEGFREKIWASRRVIILGPNNLVSYLATLKMAHEAVHVNSSALKIFQKVSDLKKDFMLFDKAITENELRSRQISEAAEALVLRSGRVNSKLDNLLEISEETDRED